MNLPRLGFLVFVGLVSAAAAERGPDDFATRFAVAKSELSPGSANPFFALTPGHQLTLKGTEDGAAVELTITVLPETKEVDGVMTRVVEERETHDGQLVEVSRNYFAASKKTNDVFYFGEDVDMYKNGRVTSHEGSWHSGVEGARFGLMMPGDPRVGLKFHQEVAPGVALDRAELVSATAVQKTPAGAFSGCLEFEESSALEAGRERKCYARGVGLVRSGSLLLVRYGAR